MDQLTPTEAAASAAAMEAVLGNDDILREILIRLGFPTSLVRAAAVSKRWFRHASDPAFLRRFRARNPPLLGFYVRDSSCRCRMRFIPLPKQDPELAAVIRFGRFELGNDVVHVSDCRDGRLLVSTYYAPVLSNCKLAVHSPLHPERGTAALTLHPASFYSDTVPHARFELLRKDSANGMPCTVVQLMNSDPDSRKVWVNVPDLLAGVYFAGRTSGPIELPENMIRSSTKYGLLADDKLYMICMKGHILGLDFQSLSLFCIKLPDGVETEHGTDIGLSSAEGSGFYLIHTKGFKVHVWRRDSSCIINGKWKLVDTICLREAFGDLADSSWYSQGAAVRVLVAAVGDNADFVLLRIHNKIFYMQTCSRTVEKIYETTPKHPQLLAIYPLVYPFMMPWPPTFPVLNDGP